MKGETSGDRIVVFTIGHSNRPLEEFLELLLTNGIGVLADVRRYPGSKRYPHFNKESLTSSLLDIDATYLPMTELGGRRTPRSESTNTAWRNASFRGYADYMSTDAFQRAVSSLESVAREKRVAVMCAEMLWWQCHRSLIADYLKSGGADVYHIQRKEKLIPHPYTSAARIVEGRLTYSP